MKRNWIPLNTIYPKEPKLSRNWAVRTQHDGHVVLWNRSKARALMSDHRQEQVTCQEFLDQARGKVLVLGLGLGYVLFPLLPDPGVVSIDVVELDPEIISLVEPVLKERDTRGILTIHQADATEWWKGRPREWDSVYVDLWYDVTGHEREEALELYGKYRDLTLPGGWCSYWDPFRHGAPLDGASVPLIQ